MTALTAFLIHVFLLKGNKKTLILREIPEDEVKKLLSKKNSLAACDVAVFVYDRYLNIFLCLMNLRLCFYFVRSLI